VVTDFGHDVKPARWVRLRLRSWRGMWSARRAELKTLRQQMYRMLKEEAAPVKMGRSRGAPAGRDFKARHASTLLTFDAVADAVSQIEAKQMAVAHV
jgi:hypothetical protein